MKEQKQTILQSVPAAEKLHKVPNFNPLQYLTRTTSKRTGEKVLKLDLAYKRLWFRLAHPNGKMLFRPLRITDQMAIFEAQLFFDGSDPTPAANFTSTKLAREVGSQYIQAAQDEALDEALDNAGFGIQLCDLVELRRETGYGSEIPLSQAEPVTTATIHGPTAAKEPERAEAAPEPKREERRPEPVKTAPQVKTETPEAAENPQTTEKPTAGETAQPPVQAAPAATQDVVQPPDAAQPEATEVVGSMLQMLRGTNPPKEEEAAVAPDPSALEPDNEQPPVEVEEVPAMTYTDEMTVEEICARMTIEEAQNVVVPFGTCKGWTLAQVLDKRPSSLRFYVYGSGEAGNVLKAAATILLNDMTQKKAG